MLRIVIPLKDLSSHRLNILYPKYRQLKTHNFGIKDQENVKGILTLGPRLQ